MIRPVWGKLAHVTMSEALGTGDRVDEQLSSEGHLCQHPGAGTGGLGPHPGVGDAGRLDGFAEGDGG